MEATSRVALWLDELDRNGAEDTVNELSDKQKDRHEPVTPPQRLSIPEALDNTSPTDTSFSSHSIFDTPSAARLPETIRRVEDFLDYESDITSIDDDEPDSSQKSASLASYDPPSEAESVVKPPPQHSLAAHDSVKSRLIWLASCLQCTLANLPCSRAVPACSRCKRNGHESTCLLQRCRFAKDIGHDSCTSTGVPILLRLKSDDDEAWHQKSKLAKELLEAWEAEQDKKNWVFPSVDSPRGHYPGFGFGVKQMHPGEGRGVSKEMFEYAPLEICDERQRH